MLYRPGFHEEHKSGDVTTRESHTTRNWNQTSLNQVKRIMWECGSFPPTDPRPFQTLAEQRRKRRKRKPHPDGETVSMCDIGTTDSTMKDSNRTVKEIINLTLEMMHLLIGENYTIVKKEVNCDMLHSISTSEEISRTQNPTLCTLSSVMPVRNKSKKILELASKIIQLLTTEEFVHLEKDDHMYEYKDNELCGSFDGTISPGGLDVPVTLPDCFKEDQCISLNIQATQYPVAEHNIKTCINSSNENSTSCYKRNLGGTAISIPLHHVQTQCTVTHDKEVSALLQEENLNNTEKYPPKEPIETDFCCTHIKEEPGLCVDHVTNTYTPLVPTRAQNLFCTVKEVSNEDWNPINQTISTNSTATPYTCFHIKQEYLAGEEGIFPDTDNTSTNFTQIKHTKQESVIDEGCHTESEMYAAADHTQVQCASLIKEECVTCENGNISYTDMYASTEYLPYMSKHIKNDLGLYKEENKAAIYMHANDTQDQHVTTGQNSQSVKKQFVCAECGKCFARNSQLCKHQRTHRGERPYSCSECEKCFTLKSSLINHQKTHTGVKSYPCLECGKSFYWNLHLVRHQRIHTGEKPYFCSECEKCFTSKGHLIRHQKIHTGEKPYLCAECGKCFISKTHLVMHQRIHTGEKPYSCVECGKFFTNKSDVVVHQRIHTGEKPYSCKECVKSFVTNSHLIRHQRVHTGERPFSCTECGKSFISRSDVVIHQRIHTGKKPYSCAECGKCFTRSSHLVSHQKTHVGKKPYFCLKCGQCFHVKSRFLNHQKIHAGKKLLTCTECGKWFLSSLCLIKHQRLHSTNINHIST